MLKQLKTIAEGKEINFYYKDNTIGITLDETTSQTDVIDIIGCVCSFIKY